MNLTRESFTNIAFRKKVIKSRLFVENRQLIAIGEEIIFHEQESPEHTIKTVVTTLLPYQTFKELFDAHDAPLFGAVDHEFLLTQIQQFYSPEDKQR